MEQRGVDESTAYVEARAAGRSDVWSERTQGRGGQRLRRVVEVESPPEVAEALGLPDGGTVVVRQRLMLLDERPVELTDSYYPAAVAAGSALAEPGKIRGGAPTLLAELGYHPHEAEEDVSVRPATPEEAEVLEIATDALVLTVFRVVYTAGGTPFEVSRMVMVPHGRHLHYRVRVGS